MSAYICFYLVRYIAKRTKREDSELNNNQISIAVERITRAETRASLSPHLVSLDRLRTSISSAKWLILLVTMSSACEWLAILMSIFIAMLDYSPSSAQIRGAVTFMVLPLIEVHSIWICLQFKMIQNLIVVPASKKSEPSHKMVKDLTVSIAQDPDMLATRKVARTDESTD